MIEIDIEIYETTTGKRPFEGGGDKSSQKKDIAKAKEYFKDFQERGKNHGKK